MDDGVRVAVGVEEGSGVIVGGGGADALGTGVGVGVDGVCAVQADWARLSQSHSAHTASRPPAQLTLVLPTPLPRLRISLPSLHPQSSILNP